MVSIKSGSLWIYWSALSNTMSNSEKLKYLCSLVRKEPHVSASIRRLMNNSLSRGFSIRENGHELNPNLRSFIRNRFMECLKEAVEMAMTCGFVAYYTRRVDGIYMPFVPALGTFTWSVIPSDSAVRKRKRYTAEHNLIEYKVKMIVPGVRAEELHIVNWMAPVHSDTELPSPLDFILEAHRRLEMATQASIDREMWNGQKHVMITENIDLKDPTPSGIQLLDEMRRYSLTGNHGQEHQQRLMAMDRNKIFNTVVDAKFHFIRSEFKKVESEHDIPVQTHVLPPNMQVAEMSGLDKSDTLQTLRENFHDSVYTLFNGSSPLTSSSKYVGTAAQDHVSRAQQVAVTAMCNWLQMVCAKMYSTCFEVEEKTVNVKMAAKSRFEIQNTEDVKKLKECGVLTDHDCRELRQWYMSEAGRDML